MKAVDTAKTQSERNSSRAHFRVAPLNEHPAVEHSQYGPVIQRKASCVCGGGCPACQSKNNLNVSHPTDAAEIEADRVAEEVMVKSTPSVIGKAPPGIRHFSSQSNRQTEAAPVSVDQGLASPGNPLEPGLREDMEQAFGHDFSRVRVHSNGAAEQSAQDVSAQAYTVGNDIVFGAGWFAPGTLEGRRLIAHELAHTIQQRGASSNEEIIRPGPASEVKPELARRDVTNGRTLPYSLGSSKIAVARKPLLEDEEEAEDKSLASVAPENGALSDADLERLANATPIRVSSSAPGGGERSATSNTMNASPRAAAVFSPIGRVSENKERINIAEVEIKEQDAPVDRKLTSALEELSRSQADHRVQIKKDRAARLEYFRAHREWRQVEIPIDHALRNVELLHLTYELDIRFFQKVLSISREEADELRRYAQWWHFPYDPRKTRKKLQTQKTITYHTNALRIVQELYEEMTEDKRLRLHEIDEILNTGPDMALEMFKDVGRGMYNGTIDFAQGLVDTPVSVGNLVQTIRGGEPVHLLDLSDLRADYQTNYGYHQGHSIELGTQLGLAVVSGKLGGSGSGAAESVSQVSRAQRLLARVNTVNAMTQGATAVIQAGQAIVDLKRGYVIVNGEKRQLTSDDILDRLIAIGSAPSAIKGAAASAKELKSSSDKAEDTRPSVAPSSSPLSERKPSAPNVVPVEDIMGGGSQPRAASHAEVSAPTTPNTRSAQTRQEPPPPTLHVEHPSASPTPRSPTKEKNPMPETDVPPLRPHTDAYPEGLAEHENTKGQAFASYEKGIVADPSREVAVYIDPVTNEHVVVQGGADFVAHDWMDEAGHGRVWQLVEHYHPGHDIGARYASPEDFAAMMHWQNVGVQEDLPVTTAIRWHDPRSKKPVMTEIGYAPGSDRPFWIKYLGPRGKWEVATFADTPWNAGSDYIRFLQREGIPQPTIPAGPSQRGGPAAPRPAGTPAVRPSMPAFNRDQKSRLKDIRDALHERDLSWESLALHDEADVARFFVGQTDIDAGIRILESRFRARAALAEVHAEAQKPHMETREPSTAQGHLPRVRGPEVPEGQRLPRATDVPDSTYGGFWGGTRGDSEWFSDIRAVNDVTGWRPVRFRKGFPDLLPWARERIRMPITGNDANDFAYADAVIARQRGFANQTAYAVWRSSNRLTWHHVEGAQEMILVPRDLHGNLPHVGGGFDARSGAKPVP
jgi:hypothetical protein